MFRLAFGSLLGACALLPAVAQAQPISGGNHPVGYTHNGYPYGPRAAPPWNYPGIYGSPYVGYAPPGYRWPGYGYPPLGFGYVEEQLGPRVSVGVGGGYPFGYGFGGYGLGYPFGYGYPFGGFGYPGFWYNRSPGRTGSTWSNGLSLYGPPVPTYGPIPGVFGANDLNRQWRDVLPPPFPGVGWVGVYAASPRPRYRTVNVHPPVEPLLAERASLPAVQNVGGCMLISVTVPQPTAEVFVDGKKTGQTGTDRTFESPPLETGKTYKYTVTARWVERGQVVEMKKDVTGTAGEVVRVDFGR